MRRSSLPAILCAVLVLVGCARSGNIEIEDILTPTSAEVTGAIPSPSNPVPPSKVGLGSEPESLPQQPMAMMPPEPVPDALAPVVRTAGMPLPSINPKKLVAPAPGRHPVVKHRFGDAKPVNFGRASPHTLAVHGVDVSRWQGEIDWEDLRMHGANFAFIKATDGGDHLDPMFHKNWRAAAAAGVKRGAYHFFYWCRSAHEQADWFIRNVPKEPGALPPVLDVEWNGYSSCKKRPSRQVVLEKMRLFLSKLEKHYGQRPIIYTAPDFYSDNLEGEFLDYPFWLRSVAAHPSQVYPGRNWLFWQYSGSGLSKGVDGKIDLNVFYGGVEDWQRWVAANTG